MQAGEKGPYLPDLRMTPEKWFGVEENVPYILELPMSG
jgi:hypothetical protein